MFIAKVVVTLKSSVLDPQGVTIKHAVDSLGYKKVEDVRMGKYFELKMKGADKASVEKELVDICEKLLINPVIESYSYIIES